MKKSRLHRDLPGFMLKTDMVFRARAFMRFSIVYLWVVLLFSIMGPQAAFAEASKPMPQPNPATYLEQVVQASSPKTFEKIYGSPKTSKVVLVLYTSLACPACRIVHRDLLPKLMQTPGVAVIDREYPADMISLWAAAMAWSVPHKASVLRDAFFKAAEGTDSWISRNPQEVIRRLQHIARPLCTSAEYALLEKVTKNRELLQAIYAQKMQDKAGVNAVTVPTAWVLRRGPNPEVFPIQNPTDETEVQSVIQKALQSST